MVFEAADVIQCDFHGSIYEHGIHYATTQLRSTLLASTEQIFLVTIQTHDEADVVRQVSCSDMRTILGERLVIAVSYDGGLVRQLQERGIQAGILLSSQHDYTSWVLNGEPGRFLFPHRSLHHLLETYQRPQLYWS